MPGVRTDTLPRSGPAADALAPSATLFAVGLTERGPTDEALRVLSYADFEKMYGGRVTYGDLHDCVRAFFEDGGTRAYIGRLVGDAAVTGTLTLDDKAGIPVNTLRIDARGAGAWSAGVTVAVAAGTIDGTFKITIAYAGTTFTYDNLSTPAQAAARINKNNPWVEATDLGSATVVPNNQPANLAATALSTGSDARGSLVAADYTDALDTLFGYDLGAGVVAIPGFTSAEVGLAMAAHCDANRRIGYTVPPVDSTVAEAIDAAQALVGVPGSEKIALLYPYIQIDDGAGGLRTVSPEGFVAGVRARAHELVGPWRAPAGVFAASSGFVRGVEKVLTRDEGNSLDDALVSAIRIIGGTVQPYGYRSLSDDQDNWRFLTYADLCNHLEVEGEKRLDQFVFETVDSDSHLLGFVEAALRGLVEPIRRAGGLFSLRNEAGEETDRGWSVNVGSSVNSLEQLAQGQVAAEVTVRPSPSGSDITLTIIKAALTAAV